MTIKSLNDLFAVQLRYAYDCEQKLLKTGLPSMIKASTAPELKRALEQHLEETKVHATRLEQVFSLIGADPDTEDNDVLDAMTSSTEELADDIDSSTLRDAALIVSGNQVEHYEMALYGSLLSFAQQLGLNQAVGLLQQTLNEEKAADAKLTQIAETSVNVQAAEERRAA
jgi:ferritin-like metal-binding protein YciE